MRADNGRTRKGPEMGRDKNPTKYFKKRCYKNTSFNCNEIYMQSINRETVSKKKVLHKSTFIPPSLFPELALEREKTGDDESTPAISFFPPGLAPARKK